MDNGATTEDVVQLGSAHKWLRGADGLLLPLLALSKWGLDSQSTGLGSRGVRRCPLTETTAITNQVHVRMSAAVCHPVCGIWGYPLTLCLGS